MEIKSIGQVFQTLEKISDGAFGTVFKAQNKETGEIVAIKKIIVSRFKSDSRRKCEREVKTLTKCQSSNVVRFICYKMKEMQVNIVLEYMPFTLSDFIEHALYPLPKRIIKTIMFSLLRGLSQVHEKSVVHRDLKPQNILIDQQGLVKIGDFGSAIELSDKQNNEFAIEGLSKWYKAPELLFGCRNYGTEIDIWSAGCIFVELINGYPLFPGINEIEQIARISRLLGTPDQNNWKAVTSMPDFGKIIFNHQEKQPFQHSCPTASQEELSLLALMLQYEQRATADQLLSHPYFNINITQVNDNQISNNQINDNADLHFSCIDQEEFADFLSRMINTKMHKGKETMAYIEEFNYISYFKSL